MNCFDCKVCLVQSFTSSAEGRRFNWLIYDSIYDSMTSLFACGRFSKSRSLSASVSFLPSFPFSLQLFYSLHSSPCNSLLPNCTETLATQAKVERMRSGIMIIKCLLPYLHRFRHNVHFREFSGLTAAIDASCWILKALSVGISQSRNREM